jgi:hypothetical protein
LLAIMTALTTACSSSGTGGPDMPPDGLGPDAGAAPAPLVLAVVPPGERVGMAGETLADDCIVELTRDGAPVVGAEITFAPAGEDSVSVRTVATDGNGRAATSWTLGFGGGVHTLTVVSTGANNVTFTAIAEARTIAFMQPQVFPTGPLPFDIKVGNFNDDHLPDVVVSLRSGPNWLAVLPNIGEGMFATPLGVPDIGTGQPRGITAGNLDGDAYDDVAVTLHRAGDYARVVVYRGLGDGQLGSHNQYNTGSQPYDVIMADFDGDGDNDLAVSNQGDNTVTIVPNKGSATFGAERTFYVGEYPQGLAVGDFNGDARQDGYDDASLASSFSDLVVAQRYEKNGNLNDEDTVGVLLGEADIEYSAVNPYGVGNHPIDVAVGDFDQDGNSDLAVANETGRTISVLRGTGTGALATARELVLAGEPQQIAVADLNGDGAPEIIVPLPALDELHIFVNDGGGVFSEPLTIGLGELEPGVEAHNPIAVAVADINDDGLPDVLSLNAGSPGTLSVFQLQ